MQSFVPDFDCDLFISSARADVGLTAGNGDDFSSWIKDLSHGMRSLLAQKLGRRDWGIVLGPSVSAEPQSEVLPPRCAVLVVVLTREYLRDDACLRELNAFLSQVGEAEATSRLFVVLADDIERKSWPVALQRHLSCDFLVSGESDAAKMPGKRRRVRTSDKHYPVRLDDLTSDIAVCLTHLGDTAQGASGTRPPTIFLGSANSDVSDVRDSMRRYLTQEGFRIVPNRWYPRENAAFQEQVLHDMGGAQMFVQLLGAVPFERVVDSKAGLGSLELELAKESGLPILGWRDPRLDLNLVVDAEHRRLIEGEFVLAVGIEEFKRKVVERAHVATTKPATSSDKPLVVVASSEIDRTLAQRVGELLDGKGLGIEIPNTEEFPWEQYSNGKNRVGGLVIVYGACPAIWVRQQLWKYRKAMARIESRPPICAVCEAPPEAKEPLRYEVPQMDTIDCRIQITEAALSSFIEAVQRRCAQ